MIKIQTDLRGLLEAKAAEVQFLSVYSLLSLFSTTFKGTKVQRNVFFLSCCRSSVWFSKQLLFLSKGAQSEQLAAK